MPPPEPFAALQPGALIGVIAPAGPSSAERRAQVPALFERFGYRVRLYPSCYQQLRYLAGTDRQRLDDLHAACADDEVAAIHCLRGGYGCGRLLPDIDTELLRAKPKLLIGYSDVTALHAVLNGLGIPSLHAPMPGSDLVQAGREADAEALFSLLRHGLRAGPVPRADLLPGAWGQAGVAEGRLLGGNLSLVASLVGTPWALPMRDDAILYLEDINEDLYRVDRLLGQLSQAGVLQAARGFLIGSFSDAESPEDVLKEYLLPLGKPVLCGWPAGHGTPNRALPLGLRVRLDVGLSTVTLLEDLLV